METVCFVGMWMLSPLMGVVGLFLFYVAAMRLMKRHKKKPFSQHLFWQVDLEKIFSFPLKLICICLGIYLSAEALIAYLGCFPVLEGVKVFRNCFVVGSLAWIVFRWKNEVLKGAQALPLFGAPGISHAINKLLSACIWIITGLMILRIFHLDVLPLLAFGGIGAAAFAFAAKDVIGNFFGGTMLSFTQPFASGDVILLPDRNLEGTVENVGWYLTCIRDKDKRPVYLPNALFSNLLVVNLSRMSHRRILETIHLRYDDFSKVPAVLHAIRTFLESHSGIDSTAPVLVHLTRLGEYSLEVYLDVYTFATELKSYLSVKEEVLQEILGIIEKGGVQVSYPTSLIYQKGSL